MGSKTGPSPEPLAGERCGAPTWDEEVAHRAGTGAAVERAKERRSPLVAGLGCPAQINSLPIKRFPSVSFPLLQKRLSNTWIRSSLQEYPN